MIGGAGSPASPMPTATPYPLGVMLNEFLPAPQNVDWDGVTADNEAPWQRLHSPPDSKARQGSAQLTKS